MDNKKNGIPKLRFPGFTGAWEQRKLGGVFSILKNNTLSRANLSDEHGAAQDIHYGDILTKFNETLDISTTAVPYIQNEEVIEKTKATLLKNGDIVLADTAEDEIAGKCTEIVGLVNQKVFAGLHTIPLRPNQSFSKGFLGFYMNSIAFRDQLKSLMQGIKVLSISKKALKETVISFPHDLREQEKIGQHLSNIDTLIALHQRKLEHLQEQKKGLLQKMFPKNGETVPEVRFPGFTDAWEQRKLGEVATRVTRKNKNLESTLPLTISAQLGLVDQISYFDKRIASSNLTNYILLNRGEFAYNKSYSNGYPFGAVKRLNRYDKGVIPSLYIAFMPNTIFINSDFMEMYFETSLWHKEVSARASEGARNHGLLNISPSDFMDIYMKIPEKIEEQKKIAKFLEDFDSLIALHQRKLDHLELMKKGLLQQMFV